jgi:phosphomannomutase
VHRWKRGRRVLVRCSGDTPEIPVMHHAQYEQGDDK